MEVQKRFDKIEKRLDRYDLQIKIVKQQIDEILFDKNGADKKVLKELCEKMGRLHMHSIDGGDIG